MKTNKTGSFSKWWKMLEPIAEIAAHKYHTPMTKPNYRQRKRSTNSFKSMVQFTNSITFVKTKISE